MDTTFIYALNDPETGECRYIGKANNPRLRWNGHKHDAQRNKKNSHCQNWINSLAARGLKPLLEILQEVPKTEWELWERTWIRASRKIGMDLTNVTDGGECGPVLCGAAHPFFGKKRSPETIANMRGKTRTAEQRARMGAARKGKQPTSETRAKISATLTGRKISPEVTTKRRKKGTGSSSRFHGVSFYKTRSCWRSQLYFSGKCLLLGLFETEIEAAKAYDAAAKKYCGELAVLNFTNE